MWQAIKILAMMIGLAIYCVSVEAQEKPTIPPDLVKQLQDALLQRDQAIRNLMQRVTALEQQVKGLKASETGGGTVGPTAAVTPQVAAQVVQSAPSEEFDKEERLARAALDRALLSHGGLLLPPKMVELDNGVSYFNSSYDRIHIDGFTVFPVLVVGDIVSERSRRDILLSSLTARVGLPHDFQAEVRVPYGWQSERTVTADNQESSQRYLGFGDVEVALTKQLMNGRGQAPVLLGGIRWKSTTGPDPFQPTSTQATLGTGFQSLQGSVTAVKPSDPLVLFGTFSYTANLSTTKQIQGLDPANPGALTLGHLNPGDTLGFQLGTALSVNPEASLNFALDQRFTRAASLDGKSLPGTYLSEAVLRLGTSYIYAPGRSVDFGLGIGLSRDSPDFQFSVNFPLRFSLARKTKSGK
jgi:hypothetical protein